MSLINIDTALIQAYISLAMGLSTAYEGEHFEPPTDGSAWASVFIVPSIIDVGSLGAGGQDHHRGFMQIDFNVKHGTGRATLVGYAQTLRTAFITGKTYTSNSQNVQITSVDRSGVREIDGWMRISVTINWIAATARPAI